MGTDMKELDILAGDRVIGSGSEIFVIAEIGLNHGGSVETAARLIDAATESGADAVKFQSYRTDRLLIPSVERYVQQADDGLSAYQMLRQCELSFEDQENLKKHADRRGVHFLSTPFDEESADFLDEIGVPLFKIASADMTHVPLLRHVASKGKPILLSTGMAFLNEVADAVWTLKDAGAGELLLMHCVSAYPAEPRDMNLRAIETLRSYFKLPVGLSDHSLGIHFAIGAAALGAVVIEKHFTFDRNAPGPDHRSSIDPAELQSLVRNLRELRVSLGDGRKCPSVSEEEGRLLGRRSIVAAVDMRANDVIAPRMLTCKRPGTGLEPRFVEKIIGMTTRRAIEKDTIMQWDDLIPRPSAPEGREDSTLEPGNTAPRPSPGKKS
jgi:N,N'-diacetyllegionaminate synthase